MQFINRLPGQRLINEFEDTELEAGYLPSENLWEVIIKFNGDISKIGEELEIEIEILSENFAIATLALEKVPLLLRYTEIEHIESPKTLTLNIKEALNKACITNVKSPEKFNLSGEGVIIAIIDSGIDYTHPDFINEDGTSRILYIWDQTATGNIPKGFTHGAEYNNEEINKALSGSNPFEVVPEIDTIGHGTAVAGIAAGNGRDSKGQNVGVAPNTSLIVVKLGEKGYPSFARTTEFMRALKYVIDKATELQMPIVVNISYGTNDGPHNGQSLFETFIDNMAEKWKTSIVVASGNEGAAGHHYEGQIKSGEMHEISFFYAGKYPSFYLTLWKNFVDSLTVELVLPGGRSTGEVPYFDLTRSFSIEDISVFINYSQPQFYNAFQEVFFQINSNNETPPVGIFTLRIRAGKVVDGKYNIYLPTTEEVSAETAFTSPSINTTLTIPSTAQNVITVGGYDSSRGIIADFSGRGYTINIIYPKPDIVAPAIGIVTTKVGGGYTAFSGTSMAAPFVSGSVALMMQWGIVNKHDLFLYGERVKAYLKSGATRFPHLTYPNSAWGYGSLCLFDTMTELRNFNSYL